MKDAGRIGFVDRGFYDPDATYEFLDVVFYGVSSYVAKKDTRGNIPEEDGEFWKIFAKGWNSEVAAAVTGVKGANESIFRAGNVSLSPDDIGALPVDGKADSAETADSVAHALTFSGAETGAYDGSSAKTINIPESTRVKGEAETEYRSGDVDITRAAIGLDRVANMTPEEIRSELTAEEVEKALGYSPSEVAIEVDDALSDVSENPVQNKVITDTLKGKGDNLFYDGQSGELQLKSGEDVLSSVPIEGGSGGSGIKLPSPTAVSLENADEEVLIKWTDPQDVVFGGSVLAQWAGTLVIRKIGSAPESETDGTIVIDSKVRDTYKETGFSDTGLDNGVEYFYGIFPYSADKAYTYGTTKSITPEAIYPDAPMDVTAKAGDGIITIDFSLPDNATGAKISYSTQQPGTTETPYGAVISNVVSPYIVAGLTNDIPYYITVYATNTKGRDTAGEMLTAIPKAAVLYGFIIDQNESDPDSMITYIEDNKDFIPAHMDYENDRFDYGSWENAWFIRDLKPCMLNYDETVAYELNPDDYTEKKDEAPSDVANEDFPGNAMVGFPKVYWKIVNNGDGTANVYFSDTKLDDDFVCWSHIDNNGNEIDYCYMSCYNGSLIAGVIRSLSGKIPPEDLTAQQAVDGAKANNLTNDIIWYIDVFSDRMLVNLLLLLIGRSTDTQNVFGIGNVGSRSTLDTQSGALDQKGLFWGNQDNAPGVKVFGIEHYWGNSYRWLAGWIFSNGSQKVKMTYGKTDGSSVEGYNLDGTGYSDIAGGTLAVTSSGFIDKMLFDKNGFFPISISGSSSTYYCDTMRIKARGTMYPMIGLYLTSGNSGAFGNFSISEWSEPAGTPSLSCKPLAKIGGN